MNLFTRLLLALAVAAVIATIFSVIESGHVLHLPLLLACALTAVVSTVLLSLSAPAAGATITDGGAVTSGDSREIGEVKWFNGTKGFGFIIRENGEEIFVHFRSIRGEGRRSLRDGQRVSFVVAQSDKGPQAEDVVPEE